MRFTQFLLGIHLLLTTAAIGQEKKTVRPDTSSKQSILPVPGRIIFTNKSTAISDLTQRDILSDYVFTHKSDLFFIAAFDKPLSGYMQDLQPGISKDSLFRQGNFQFSLYVDERLIYRSNLLPGAPSRGMQDTALVLNRALVNNLGGTGSWSESFWNRFIEHGGDSALSDGIHAMKMEIRPYIRVGERVMTGSLMAAGEVLLRIRKNTNPDISQVKLNTPSPYNDLTVSKEKFDHRKIKELKAKIEDGVFKQIAGLIVLKHGQLLIEEYFNGATRHTMHDPRSVGKSFASTLIGLAITDRYIRDEHMTLKDFYTVKSFANYRDEKEKVTLKDLMTMSSAFDGDDDIGVSPGNEENMYPTNNWVKFAMDLPVKPGNEKGEWHYFTAGVILLGDVLNKKVSGGLEAYAAKRLFQPLGIRQYQWQYTPQKVPNTAGGIQMSAIDFAKYGQLYKNNGSWGGKQILSPRWIGKTFSKHKVIGARENEFYGYLFWNKNFRVADKTYEAWYCAGNGGNYILIFKDVPLVVVITATVYGRSYAHTQATKMITEYILPAVIQ